MKRFKFKAPSRALCLIRSPEEDKVTSGNHYWAQDPLNTGSVPHSTQGFQRSSWLFLGSPRLPWSSMDSNLHASKHVVLWRRWRGGKQENCYLWRGTVKTQFKSYLLPKPSRLSQGKSCLRATTLPRICQVLLGRQPESLHPWLPRPVNVKLHLLPNGTGLCQDSHNARHKHYPWPQFHLDLVSGKDSSDNIF